MVMSRIASSGTHRWRKTVSCRLVFIAFILLTQSFLWANPEDYLKRQEMLYRVRIEKAEKELKAANTARDKKLVDATKAFVKELEKVKVYWTKKGNLEKALAYKKRIENLEVQVSSGKVDSDTVKKSIQGELVDYALATNGASVKSTGKSTNRETDARIVDGITGNSKNYSAYSYPCTHTINLGKLRTVRHIRMHLWNHDSRSYQFKIYVSTYGRTWKVLADHSKKWSKGVQEFEHGSKKIQYLRIEGIRNTANGGFHVKELEAFNRKPE
jgi:hypothetical protein